MTAKIKILEDKVVLHRLESRIWGEELHRF
jgi:hypothetical protein